MYILLEKSTVLSRSNIINIINKYAQLLIDSGHNLRNRNFDRTQRIIQKYITPYVWYSDTNIKDPYRSLWKNHIKRKSTRGYIKKLSPKNRRGADLKTSKAALSPSDAFPPKAQHQTKLTPTTTTTAIFVPIVITEVLRATTTHLRYFSEEATSNLGARVEGCQEPFLFLPGTSWQHIFA